MKLILVAGTRPNFVKIAPLIRAIEAYGPAIEYRLVHTGQHFDEQLDRVFFHDLNIPEPHINFNVQSGSHAQQTASIMVQFEAYLEKEKGIVVVVGDVNSTLACSIVAKKMNLPLVHVEAGIRSGDTTMPEEINRLVTDAIADQFFTTSTHANEHLRKAGVAESRIHFVGNVMIDSLTQNAHKFRAPEFWDAEKLSKGNYWLLTLHRPSNVDSRIELGDILKNIERFCEGQRIVFPVHPRTSKTLAELKINAEHFLQTPPLGYLEFMYLIQNAAGVITDSGGIQEETTVMDIPCLTLRTTTERPETIHQGTNILVPDASLLEIPIQDIRDGKHKKGSVPELWDGKAAERIIKTLYNLYENAE